MTSPKICLRKPKSDHERSPTPVRTRVPTIQPQSRSPARADQAQAAAEATSPVPSRVIPVVNLRGALETWNSSRYTMLQIHLFLHVVLLNFPQLNTVWILNMYVFSRKPSKTFLKEISSTTIWVFSTYRTTGILAYRKKKILTKWTKWSDFLIKGSRYYYIFNFYRCVNSKERRTSTSASITPTSRRWTRSPAKREYLSTASSIRLSRPSLAMSTGLFHRASSTNSIDVVHSLLSTTVTLVSSSSFLSQHFIWYTKPKITSSPLLHYKLLLQRWSPSNYEPIFANYCELLWKYRLHKISKIHS